MDLVLVGNMKCTLQVQLCVCSYELGGVEPELISANIIPQLPSMATGVLYSLHQ